MQASAELADLPPLVTRTEPPPSPSPVFRVPYSRVWIGVICTILAIVLGYLDYLTGYEQSLLLFYLVPIAIATWFGGLIYGLIFSILSVLVWVMSDIFAGIAIVSFWNLGMAFAAYVVFTVLLAKLRSLLSELEDRVRERTKALRRE